MCHCNPEFVNALQVFFGFPVCSRIARRPATTVSKTNTRSAISTVFMNATEIETKAVKSAKEAGCMGKTVQGRYELDAKLLCPRQCWSYGSFTEWTASEKLGVKWCEHYHMGGRAIRIGWDIKNLSGNCHLIKRFTWWQQAMFVCYGKLSARKGHIIQWKRSHGLEWFIQEPGMFGNLCLNTRFGNSWFPRAGQVWIHGKSTRFGNGCFPRAGPACKGACWIHSLERVSKSWAGKWHTSFVHLFWEKTTVGEPMRLLSWSQQGGKARIKFQAQEIFL